MTIDLLLDQINEEKPNTFIDEKIIGYVNEIEVRVATWLKIPRDDVPVYEDTATDRAMELLIPEPYDCLYISWVKAKIDFAQEEYASYQLNMAQFELDADNAQDWIVRTNQTEGRSPMVSRFSNTF